MLVLVCGLAAAFLYLGKTLSEAYPFWAKLFGPVGRYWERKGAKRTEARAQLHEDHLADVDSLSRQLNYQLGRVEFLERDNQDLLDFVYEDHQWHYQAKFEAVESGCNLPDWVPYLRWRKLRTPREEQVSDDA